MRFPHLNCISTKKQKIKLQQEPLQHQQQELR